MKQLIMKMSRFIPDPLYITILYYKNIRKFLNLKSPKTFNEKLQWIKIHDRNPEYTRLVNKYEVRSYIASKIGEKYLITLIGVWDSVFDINFNNLPNKFVLKCNHDSKSTVICRDKSRLDIRMVRNKLDLHLKQNAFWYGREWPYKDVKPCIIAEKYMEDTIGTVLTDYKVLCFNGKAKLIQVHNGRGTQNYTQDFYDIDWNKTNIMQGARVSQVIFEKPSFLKEMVELSETLAEGTLHSRIDWYFVKGQIYFGEITFFDGSGFVPFENEEDDLLLGSWIKLN